MCARSSAKKRAFLLSVHLFSLTQLVFLEVKNDQVVDRLGLDGQTTVKNEKPRKEILPFKFTTFVLLLKMANRKDALLSHS